MEMITSIFTKVIADYFWIRQSLSLWFWVEHVEKVFAQFLMVRFGFLVGKFWYHCEHGMRQNGGEMYDRYVTVNEARIKGSKVHLNDCNIAVNHNEHFRIQTWGIINM